MSNPSKIGIVVGSLRKDSITRRVAQAMAKLSPGGAIWRFVEIGALPIYNPDLDEAGVPAWTAFRDEVKALDGVLFATPEYNRSMPGALKNAIDVGSRPYGKSAWSGKPAGIVSVSPGALGAFGANHHLRQSLVFLNMPAMAQPEAYVGNSGNILGADGDFVEASRGFFKAYVEAFEAWVKRHAPVG
ncbi:MAG: NAD(P)H-dependent oxidoreductase [Hyphomicrobiales bacterium]|nr:NAD(P)H-dependent oxidoreductase [Hyphomicrobiales bacterium]MDE2017563.1 NAD(P)H-dependent oxidoreductase [Hyphomicrobiales bacterium]